MQYTIKIRLRKPRRVLTFLCDENMIRRDEPCIVESDRGLEWGTCVLPPEPCPVEMRDRYPMHVLRRADPEDHETQQAIETDEAAAHKICLRHIQRREMPMKLVDAEYTFDRKKVVFYFTAEDRVDFRELVRDLAHELRARIELRHIQVRDEAKMVGGIGSCGRELCCSSWLNEFSPISMRMAKRQNLSLNPSKISGQCGRLLCCLSYENDQYETAKRRARQMQEVEQVAAPTPEAAPAEEPWSEETPPEKQEEVLATATAGIAASEPEDAEESAQPEESNGGNGKADRSKKKGGGKRRGKRRGGGRQDN